MRYPRILPRRRHEPAPWCGVLGGSVASVDGRERDSRRHLPAELEVVDPVDGTRWLIDTEFLSSRWTCIWDQGCKGIADQPDVAGGLGCCSVGAQMLDDDEAMNIAALAATLDPSRWQFHAEATTSGVLLDDRSGTRVVDGACVFLNRPGFAGGPGCALHIAAVDDEDDPTDWKPSVCWQLPLKVDRTEQGPGPTARLRRWQRSDWGSGGETMAWCCTEAPEAFVGDAAVVVTLEREIAALVGPEVAVAIRSALEHQR